MPRVVKIIPSTLQEFTSTPLDKHTKKRVAGYARVSTDSEDQTSSYQIQVNYYNKYISSKANWNCV